MHSVYLTVKTRRDTECEEKLTRPKTLGFIVQLKKLFPKVKVISKI